MNDRVRATFYRLLLNWAPCIRGGGGRVTDLARDFTSLTVELPLGWRTRNIVGTIYGGSMYASTDPMFMLMLTQILGKHYVVWDKGCTIRFKRPARSTLYAKFEITPEMLADVLSRTQLHDEGDFTWTVQYRDASGKVFAEFDKVLYVARKNFYRDKIRRREEREMMAI